MNKKLLLISNSTNAGEAYLDWPKKHIKDFIGNRAKRILFIPYAGVTISYDEYAKKVNEVFKTLGYTIYSIHLEKDPIKAVQDAEAIAVGGGNTFHLVHMLHKLKLIEPIRMQVEKGILYLGWSAGANVACPSLKTTNDMPIIEPESFDCLKLVPFQINPHYLDAHPQGHGGETREQRILEFLEANKSTIVVGLREASLLHIENNQIKLVGDRAMRLFKYGDTPLEFQPNSDIHFLLK